MEKMCIRDRLMIALIESPTIEGISKKLMEGLPSEETKEKQESLILSLIHI